MSKEWYPIVNYDLCISCGVCHEFCPHGVYESNEDGSPLVVRPEGCIQGCHGCENQCSSGAISYYGDLPGKTTGGAYRLDFNF